MASVRNIDSSTKIQMQNMRSEINNLKEALGSILLTMKETNPELVLKYMNLVEKANG